MGQQKIVDGLDTNIKWAAFLFTKIVIQPSYYIVVVFRDPLQGLYNY